MTKKVSRIIWMTPNIENANIEFNIENGSFYDSNFLYANVERPSFSHYYRCRWFQFDVTKPLF